MRKEDKTLWEIPRTPENAWLFKPYFDVSEEKELAEDEQEQRKNSQK